MKDFYKKHKVKAICVVVFIVILCSIGASNIVRVNNEWANSFQELDVDECTIFGYEEKEGALVNEIGDAHLQLPPTNQFIGGVTLAFSEPLKQTLNITVYYANAEHGYSERYTESVLASKGTTSAHILLEKEVTSCRIDVGTNTGEEFSLDSIYINDEAVRQLKVFKICIQYLLCLLVAAAIMLAIIKYKVSIEKTVAVLAFVIGIFYLVTITPLSPPDEPHHYQSAYELSNFLLMKWDEAEKGFASDFDYTNLAGHHNTANAYVRVMEDVGKQHIEGEIIDIPKPRALDYFIEYLPQALGIALARLLNINFIKMFYLGRLFNLVFYVVLLYLAIKRTPKFKLMIGLVGLLPMSLHQAASYSYDAFINAVSFYLIASILKGICEEGMLSKRDYFCILVPALLLAPTKVVYVVLAFLSVLIPAHRFEGTKDRIIKIGAIIAGSLLVLCVFRMTGLIARETQSIVSLNAEGEHNYSIQYAIQNPLNTVAIFGKTLKSYGQFYVNTCLGSTLSGLSLVIPLVYIDAFKLILVLSSFNSEHSDFKMLKKYKIAFFFTVCIVILLTMYSMFTGHTSDTSELIEGVQGRYFIPILPLLLMIFNNQVIVLRKDISKICIAIVMLLHAGVIDCIVNYTI